MDLKGKVVVVTGGSNGIGEQVVRILVEEGVKHVAIFDIDEKGTSLEEELNSEPGNKKVGFHKVDITNEDQLYGAMDRVTEEYDYIDVLVNNAGICQEDDGVWRKQVDINLTALMASTFKYLEQNRKDSGGRGGTVLNVSSVAALYQVQYLPSYYATKAAVLQFSSCLGVQDYYKRTGVRVMTICFGGTETPLMDKITSHDPALKERDMGAGARALYVQSAESAARGVVEVIKCGASGSVWLSTDDKPVQDITPEYRKAYDNFTDLVFGS